MRGTRPARWYADYDYGGKRMILWVNTESPSDDFVGLDDDGTATVMLPFSDDDTKYTIRLSDGEGPGVVKFRMKGTQNWLATLDIDLGEIPGEGWRSSLEVEIYGDTAGNDRIHAANTAVSEGGTLLNDPDGVDADCPVVALSVKAVKVKLANPGANGALAVYSDDKGEDVGASAEWTNEGRREAAAFVRGEDKKINFKVTFIGPAGKTVKVKAVDGQTTYVNETDIVFPDGEGNAEKEAEIEIQEPIGNAVALHQWLLKWQYKSGETWIDTTQTQHRVYVVLDSPKMTGKDYQRDSFYYVACYPCRTKTNGGEIIASLNSWLSDLSVSNARQTLLAAYENKIMVGVPTSAQGLVTRHNGACGAWANLMRFSLWLHKLDNNRHWVGLDAQVLPRPKLVPPRPILLFKPFTFNGNGTLGGNYPYKVNPELPDLTEWAPLVFRVDPWQGLVLCHS